MFAASCSYALYQTGSGNEENSPLAMDPFARVHAYSIYTFSADILRNHYSGLFVINPSEEGGYRTVMMTEFGLKIADIEFSSSGNYQVHYCIPAINKRYVIKTLAKDIGMLFGQMDQDNGKLLIHKQSGAPVWRQQVNGASYYYYMDEEMSRIRSIVNTGIMRKKVRADFFGNGKLQPDSIALEHYHMNIKFKFRQLDEITTPTDE